MPPWSCTACWPMNLRRPADLDLRRRDGAAPRVVFGILRHHRRQTGHRLRLLEGDLHVDHAVLQGLVAADRRAELLAGLQIVERRLVERGHGADRLGAECRDRRVDRAFDDREGIVQRPEHGLRPDGDIRQLHLRAAQTVDGGRSRARIRLGAPVDQEQRDATGSPPLPDVRAETRAGRPCRREAPRSCGRTAGSRRPCAGRPSGRRQACSAPVFAMCEGQQQGSRRERAKQLLLLPLVSGSRDQAAGDDDR